MLLIVSLALCCFSKIPARTVARYASIFTFCGVFTATVFSLFSGTGDTREFGQPGTDVSSNALFGDTAYVVGAS